MLLQPKPGVSVQYPSAVERGRIGLTFSDTQLSQAPTSGFIIRLHGQTNLEMRECELLPSGKPEG